MRQIVKNKEPHELSVYKKEKDAAYDGPNFTIVKDKIRLSLLLEQGFLCAYCMERIDLHSMKIEHWACQHSNKNLQLDYKNLLACCKGNEGSPPKEQTCDTRKGGNEIKFSPANTVHRMNEIIKYDLQGNITSTDFEFNEQIDKYLNLNRHRLKLNRATVIKTIQKILHQKIGERKNPEIMKLINFYNQKNDTGKFAEYYGTIVYYLQRKL
ncbi:Uncharacterised protein [Yersinia intermedia]|uniref:retron system putative HNH endonuclease n=1 Tax=Yersinia intermedia TaxID=631 RepID=UPI0005187028|nr:retron system putative HNH endonuclease [Yersinia intermedia]VDZ58723.1 Uncharacterised protein [Yersinia intermedia]